MRSVLMAGLLAGPLLLGRGCQCAPESKHPESEPKDESVSKFASRFEAAKAIRFSDERDAALAKVCEDAAGAGDGEMVKKCLAEIGFSDLRDDTAYKSAFALARAGSAEAATEVAKSIKFSDKRDKALSKLAKGDIGK